MASAGWRCYVHQVVSDRFMFCQAEFFMQPVPYAFDTAGSNAYRVGYFRGARTNKSHDRAYENTVRNGAMNELDIASAGGAKEGMIAYIKERMENETASFE